MSQQRLKFDLPEKGQLTPNWTADRDQTCVVCGRPSGGKAICSDARCAQELAQG